MNSRLTLKNIDKSFGTFKANSDISLELAAGEIHAILGENGAGKSTLMKILYGIQQADNGEIYIEGKRVTINSPRAARALGIGMIFQHFSLFENMSVLENIALGLDEPLNLADLNKRVNAVLANYSLPLDPTRMVHTLSVGEKQRVEIVRCLLQNPRILIMDEPTSVLTPQEVEGLFVMLNTLKSQGVSILYISHKLHEIKAICDKATVLRLGSKVAEVTPANEPTQKLAELMIGAELKTLTRIAHKEGEVVLSVNNLSHPAPSQFAVTLQNVSFEAKKGEILGLAGVSGNGQNELMLCLTGEMLVTPSQITLKGENIGALPPNNRRKRGLLSVPEERNGHAAVPELALYENALLTTQKNRVIDWQATKQFTKDIIAQFDVRTRGLNSTAKSLSGGNLQKFIIGREILGKPKVLVVSQPTWGVDAGAAEHIRQKLLDLANEGAAIVVISQDLDELFELSDKIAVFHGGRLSKTMIAANTTRADIGLLMGAAHD